MYATSWSHDFLYSEPHELDYSGIDLRGEELDIQSVNWFVYAQLRSS